MTPTQRGILLLLKSAITGECGTLPQDFSLEEMAKIARLHQVVPLVYTGALHCGISSKDPVMQSLFVDFVKATIKSEGQLQDLNRVLAAFREHGIDHLPLKGCNMKALYPKPELRTMGDADILIRMEQEHMIRKVMQELGFAEKQQTDHEWIWKSNKLYVELHKRLFPSSSKDYHSYFADCWRSATPADGFRYVMSPEDEFIYLFVHFARHCRDGGAGCRYILDLWVYRCSYPQLQEDYIRRELALLQVLEFYDNICKLLYWWKGDGTPDEITEFLSDFIFSSGTWGRTEPRKAAEALLQFYKPAGSLRRGRLRSLMFAFFPPADVVARRYPVVGRHPWLLPVFWPIRWISALLFRRENIRREQQHQRSIAPQHVQQHQDTLRYIGLDFHF